MERKIIRNKKYVKIYTKLLAYSGNCNLKFYS